VMARTMSCATEGFSAITSVFISTSSNLLQHEGKDARHALLSFFPSSLPCASSLQQAACI
jgi:hypothetical protein